MNTTILEKLSGELGLLSSKQMVKKWFWPQNENQSEKEEIKRENPAEVRKQALHD